MTLRTTQDMLDEIRDLADVDEDYIGDTLLLRLLNTKLAGLYRRLVAVNKDLFLEVTPTITTVVGTAAYSLPADFWRPRGVDRQDGSRWRNMGRFNFSERNTYQDATEASAIRYSVMGQELRLAPVPSSVFDIRVWYCPSAPTLVLPPASPSSWNGFCGYEELAVLDSVIMIKTKQEENVQAELLLRQAVIDDIMPVADDHDDAEPQIRRDVDLEGVDKMDAVSWW